MKSYTDIEQSKKLAEILPIESADMRIGNYVGKSGKVDGTNIHYYTKGETFSAPQIIEAWSLTALLGVLPFHLVVNNKVYAFSMVKGLGKNGEIYAIKYTIFNTTSYLHLTDFYDNPVDACYEMIVWLKENNKINNKI